MKVALRSLVFGCALGVGAVSAPAHAYVRTVTKSYRAPMYWPTNTPLIVVYTGSPPAPLTRDSFLAAVQASADAWSAGALGCTALRIGLGTTSASSGPATDDRTNRLMFRQESWCHDPRDPDEPCYDPSALAITSVWAEDRQGRRNLGEILDADMEINGVDFEWDDLVARSSRNSRTQDLQNTLTHEFGHFVGLDHTCYIPSLAPRPNDHMGQPIPDCGITAPQPVRETTMYASVVRGDTTRRTLEADDVQAVCDVYRAGTTPPRPGGGGDEGGCAYAGPGATRGAGATFTLLFAWLAFRVARRRSPG